MNRKRVLILILFSLAFYLLVAVLLDSLSEEYFISDALYRRDSPSNVAYAFFTALRLNHEVAYEVTAPELWPRVDEWMETHQVRECEWWGLTGEYSGVGVSDGEYDTYGIFFMCNYFFEVDDIKVKDGLVVDWGEVE
jgi:hypothetical protein